MPELPELPELIPDLPEQASTASQSTCRRNSRQRSLKSAVQVLLRQSRTLAVCLARQTAHTGRNHAIRLHLLMYDQKWQSSFTEGKGARGIWGWAGGPLFMARLPLGLHHFLEHVLRYPHEFFAEITNR